MPLNLEQIKMLEEAITNYDFPAEYFDFSINAKVKTKNMAEVECVINKQLTTDLIDHVKFGLANVVYWGNATAGYQTYRTNQLLQGVTNEQLNNFNQLVSSSKIPTLHQIKTLKIPQFSGISFISKIVTFLDPKNYCVLDLLVSRLGHIPGSKALHSVKSTTGIAVSKNNSSSYYRWCNECLEISKKYYEDRFRAVDIERGFFCLIRNNKLKEAQHIYNDA